MDNDFILYIRERRAGMSVSLWAYTESCDGRPCSGDCDLCGKAEEDEEEEDG